MQPTHKQLENMFDEMMGGVVETPRKYTQEEMRDKFLTKLHSMVNECANASPIDAKTACERLAFSILATLDGCDLVIPPIDLVPRADNDYVANMTKNNYNHWGREPLAPDIELHSLFHAMFEIT